MTFIEGKVALVTGGASGIGLAIVKELLKNGASVVSIVDIVEESGLAAVTEVEEQFGLNKSIFIKADVSEKIQLEEAFEKTVKMFKQLDIVVNNAGILNELNWERMVAINLNGVIHGSFLAMEKYLPKYKSGDEGVIVNIASNVAFQLYHSLPVYSATKQGVVALSRSLGGSEYYKKYKVRVLTMCPGLINTPMTKSGGKGVVPWPELLEEDITRVQAIIQEPEFIGRSFIEIVKNGKNGSVWFAANGNPPCEVVVPEIKELMTCRHSESCN